MISETAVRSLVQVVRKNRISSFHYFNKGLSKDKNTIGITQRPWVKMKVKI